MRLLIAFGLLFVSLAGRAQRIEYFTIGSSDKIAPVAGTRYGKIELMDARFDTSCYGTVSALRKKRSLVQANPSLGLQLQSLVDRLGGKGEHTLLLQLRDFRFAELTSNFREEGHCYLRANLFEKNGDNYALLAVLDSTIFVIKNDATSTLFRKASEVISGFLAGIINKAPSDSVLSYAQLLAIDSIEKRKLPLYTTDSLRTGIYYSYASLKQQKPDLLELMPRYNKKGRLKEVKIHMGEVDEVMKHDFCYAIVDRGKIWLSTEFGYYQLKRTGDHFEFDGLIFANAATSKVIVGFLQFGILGAIAGSSPDVYHCHMRVHHLSGDFLPIKMGERTGFY
ncbi:MAG: hypothetical protein EOO15_09805 [Chitinophagaceae bacterium]|nr:MAG: hypothetical protein EOO15_09805 [Chitinophagaceae bacterium]